MPLAVAVPRVVRALMALRMDPTVPLVVRVLMEAATAATYEEVAATNEKAAAATAAANEEAAATNEEAEATAASGYELWHECVRT